MSTSTDPRFNIFESPGKELFAGMFDKEKIFVAPPGYVHDKGIIALRQTAVATVESLCNNCSDALIPYVAMTYFDRYLSCLGATIPSGKEKLFAICCVTLAWRLRNSSFKRSTFLEEKGLLEQEEKGLLEQYRVQDVIDMELLIGEGLNWQLRTLTPFSFIKFYIPFLRRPPNTLAALHHVYQLIIRSQCDIAFAEFRPSVLAACAMIIVSSKMLPDQQYLYTVRIGTEIEPLRLQMNMILKCCELLKTFYRNPPICKPPDIPISPTIPDDVLLDFELGWDEWLKDCEVRDAPALTFADIGISMGIPGTEIQKKDIVEGEFKHGRIVAGGLMSNRFLRHQGTFHNEASSSSGQAPSVEIPTFKEEFFKNKRWILTEHHMQNVKESRFQGSY